MTDALLQWLLNGDILQFVIAVYTERIGQAFYGVVLLFFSIVFYNRTRSMAFISVMWLLLGGLFTVWFMVFSPLAVLLVALGLSGIVYSLLEKEGN